MFSSARRQRCQFRLQQNAQSYLTRQEQKAPLAASIRAIFNAGSRQEAETLLSKLASDHRKNNPKLADGLKTNGLERVNQEVKRRTRVARLFPNEASCLRLVSAILMEISEEWETGKAYLTFTP